MIAPEASAPRIVRPIAGGRRMKRALIVAKSAVRTMTIAAASKGDRSLRLASLGSRARVARNHEVLVATAPRRPRSGLAASLVPPSAAGHRMLVDHRTMLVAPRPARLGDRQTSVAAARRLRAGDGRLGLFVKCSTFEASLAALVLARAYAPDARRRRDDARHDVPWRSTTPAAMAATLWRLVLGDTLAPACAAACRRRGGLATRPATTAPMRSAPMRSATSPSRGRRPQGPPLASLPLRSPSRWPRSARRRRR